MIANDLLNNMGKFAKKTWFGKLVDMNDTTVSSSTVFLIIITFISLFLLLIPAAALIVDLIYNHTVTMSWSDIASYIGAVGVILTSGGIVKGWSNYTNSKSNQNMIVSNNENEEEFEESE